MSPQLHFCFGPFRMDPANAQLWRDQQTCALRPKAFAVLHYPVQHAGDLVTKSALLEAVWPETVVSESTLKVCVDEIRKTLGDPAKAPRFIATVYRRGYRFIAPVSRITPPAFIPPERAAPAPPSRPVVPPPAAASLPFLVGRDTALASLHAWLTQARGGERQVVLVTGEAGMGKTALVGTFLAQAETTGDLLIAQGQCVEHYGPGEAYLPVLDALGRLCRVPGRDYVLTLLRQHAPLWMLQMPWLLTLQERDSLQRELLGTTRERMLREFADFIEVLTARTPLMLVLEDLHWSDYATLDLIALLARRQEPASLLLLGTYRPVEVIIREHPLHTVKQNLRLRSQCHELTLEFLTAAQVTAYLAAQYRGSETSATLPRMLHQRTDGHPFFMVSMLEDFVNQGILVECQGTWQVSAALGTVQSMVPEGIRQLIEQQLERLTLEEQRVIEAASVVGMEFSAAAVAASAMTAVPVTEDWCDGLARRQHFLRTAGTTTWPDGTMTGRYAFRHALYQHVVYQRLARTRRASLHQRLGERVETAYGDRAAEVAAVLAGHFAQGRDYCRAVFYCQQAAQNALQRHAHQEAIEHLSRGRELLAFLPDTPERARQALGLHLALGAPLIATRGYAAPEVLQTYQHARELCARVGDTPQLFSALRGLWNGALVQAELTTARELGGQLLALAQQLADPALHVEAHRALGTTLYFLGEPVTALQHLRQAMVHYHAMPHPDLTFAYGADPGVMCQLYTALALWLLGYTEQAQQSIQTALTLAQERAHPFSLVFAMNSAALLHQDQREPAQAQALAEAAMAIAAKQGFSFFRAWSTMLLGWALTEQGHEAEGMARLQQGAEEWQATGAQLTRPYTLTILAEVYGKRGHVAAGLHMLDEALATLSRTGERSWEAEIHRLKGEFLLYDPDAARQAETTPEACLQQALAIARRQHARRFELRAALSLARLWQHQGKCAAARELLQGVYAWFTEGLSSADLQAARALCEELSA